MPCDENPCQNGAVCLLEDEHQVCYCVPDYHGALCELKYDDCESKFARCDNGGTCVDGINSFTCSCPPNYGGPMCEYSFFSTTTSVEVADTSEAETSLIKSTTSVVPSEASTLIVDTSLSLSSTSTTSFSVYSTTSRTSSSPYTKRYTFPDKTTTTSGYDDGSSTGASSDVSVFLTVPSTKSATVRDTTQDNLVTSESVPSVTTESHLRTTEMGSTEAYFPTGRSVRDDEVTKESSVQTTKTYSSYDQTTKTYSPTDRTYENVTHVTEYTMSFR